MSRGEEIEGDWAITFKVDEGNGVATLSLRDGL